MNDREREKNVRVECIKVNIKAFLLMGEKRRENVRVGCIKVNINQFMQLGVKSLCVVGEIIH